MSGPFVSQPLPISGLARLGVKPTLCRSSWGAFASTHRLMLPSTCSREALLACPPFPTWNLPSFIVDSTLSSPCSRSDPPLSLTKVRLSPTLTLSPLMIWCFGQTALFLILFVRAAPAFLPSALSVALRPLFPFRQAQYAQVFPLKPAPFCTLFAGLGSTNKSAPAFLPTAVSVALRPLFPFRQAQYARVFPLKPAPFSTLFAGLGSTNKSAISLLLSYYLTLVLSSPPCPLFHLSCYIKLCGRSGRNCHLSPPALSDYNGSPDTRFSPGTTRLTS